MNNKNPIAIGKRRLNVSTDTCDTEKPQESTQKVPEKGCEVLTLKNRDRDEVSKNKTLTPKLGKWYRKTGSQNHSQTQYKERFLIFPK